MNGWLRRLRGALGMGLTWAVGWALVGGVIELITNFVPGWNGALVDMWPQTLAIPAFFGGAAFSVVLAVAGRRRTFEELSLPRFLAWGAVGGVLLSIPVLALSGFATGAWVASGVVTSLCAASAAGTLGLARMAGSPASGPVGRIDAGR